MSVPEKAWRLDGISPRAYQHPADRAASASLAKVPYLDQVVRRVGTQLGDWLKRHRD